MQSLSYQSGRIVLSRILVSYFDSLLRISGRGGGEQIFCFASHVGDHTSQPLHASILLNLKTCLTVASASVLKFMLLWQYSNNRNRSNPLFYPAPQGHFSESTIVTCDRVLRTQEFTESRRKDESYMMQHFPASLVKLAH